MNADGLAQLLAQRFGGDAVQRVDAARAGRDLVLRLDLAGLAALAGILWEWGFFLEFITAVEEIPGAAETQPSAGEAGLELVHMWGRPGGPRVEARAAAPPRAEAPSLVGFTAAADWQEREVWDMFGLGFAGRPDLARILLPEDADFHPLRHDFRAGPELNGDRVDTEPV